MKEKTIDITAQGEALVDMISTERGVTVENASGFVKAFGGALANVAVGCARLGARTAFIGKVGSDPFGEYLCAYLRDAGAVTDGLVFSDTHNTSLVFVSLDEASKPSFYFYGKPSADLKLEAEEVNVEILKSSRFFHFGTVSLSAEPSRSATQFAVRTARRAGAVISYDPNIRFHMWDDPDEAIKWALRMMPEADIVKINDDEAEWLVGTRDPEAATSKLMELGPRLAVVTLGAEGAFFAVPDQRGRVPAFKANVVDTTGAGDAFVTGLLTGLASSGAVDPLSDVEIIKKSLVRAAVAAALTTEAMGAVSAMPEAETLEKAIKSKLDTEREK